MSERLGTTLKRERETRALTQQAMAELAGVSRQSYAAIETGRSVPSTDIALRLGRALGVGVEALFQLPEARPDIVEAESLGPISPGRVPVRLAEVEGRWVAIPLAGTTRREFVPADGIATASGPDRVRVELLADRPSSCDLVAVGCDPSFALVAAELRRLRGVSTAVVSRGSLPALEALAAGRAHVAGIHLADPETGEYDDTWVTRLVPFPCMRIRFASWEQGILVRPDAGDRIGGVADLARPGVRFLNRDSGSGTRLLLDLSLRAAGVASDAIPGYEGTAAGGHLAVAEAIASGLADAGVGIRAAGTAYGLDLVPLAREWYDLVIPRHFLDLPAVHSLLDLLRTPALRSQVEALGGYDVGTMGEPLGLTRPRTASARTLG